ncbi:flagellar export chaperone FliS [Endozoicomonas arenosclerae]|uniref:flagellar export chaperone FliS n=1 Tax=Endozoicomonas arenosclerae TaxID=1633495 RepID=UPI000780346A|nr:flagellar export chaperone FliS [Endozoicomonas arenosclerae]
MANSAAVNAYSKVQGGIAAEVATPQRMVQLLFSALMKDLHQARGFMERKQRSEKAQCIDKALDIIITLNSSIDMQAGGEMSANLRALYQYSMQGLIQANAQDDSDKLEEVIRLMGDIKSAWDAITDGSGAPDEKS